MFYEIVDLARALALRLKDRARDGEKHRKMPQETVDDLIRSGVPRTMIPNRYGGHQEDWETVAELIMEIARGDGSQAWVAAVYRMHALDVSMFEEIAQHEVWGTVPNTLVVSAVAPSGKGKA